MIEEPLNIDQAARFLGLKKGTVYNMIARRAIPYHKVGRRVLFTQGELASWFDSTLVPSIPSLCRPGNKHPGARVDVGAIIKNVVEKITHSN